MRIKHHELIPDVENPFAGCKLEREPYARILTDIVNTYADGFVLAINNEWGTGKTTFVKMWQQQLKNEGFQTVYFNAWENDFDSNPLVAIMSELETLTNSKNKKVFKSVIKKAAVLSKNIAPALAKSLIKKYIVDIDDIAVDAFENVAKASTEILEKEIEEYASKKKTIIEFRNELEKFVRQSENTKPLVFIIDELDRCRPTYAVDVLEQIKHFFSVKGIVFVLSIDKVHLASSVKGYYGSEEINTDEYLRRFIDLEYSIPKPSNKVFCEYLFEYFSFKEFFYSEERVSYRGLQEDTARLLFMAETLFDRHNVTLRQQEKIFAHTRLVVNLFRSDQHTFAHLLFFLIFVKTLRNDLYAKIESKKLELQDLSDEFYHTFFPVNKTNHRVNLSFVEALLIHFYNNNFEQQFRTNLIWELPNGVLKSRIQSKLDGVKGTDDLFRHFKQIDQDSVYRDLTLNYLLDKINLTHSIQIG